MARHGPWTGPGPGKARAPPVSKAGTRAGKSMVGGKQKSRCVIAHLSRSSRYIVSRCRFQFLSVTAGNSFFVLAGRDRDRIDSHACMDSVNAGVEVRETYPFLWSGSLPGCTR